MRLWLYGVAVLAASLLHAPQKPRVVFQAIVEPTNFVGRNIERDAGTVRRRSHCLFRHQYFALSQTHGQTFALESGRADYHADLSLVVQKHCLREFHSNNRKVARWK